jgi:anti-sigma B factor antagonist
MELQVIERDDGFVQVALFGTLDAQGAHEIDVRFHGITAAQRKPTIVDLTGVEFMNSLGVGMLIACSMSLKRHGAAMVLVCPPDSPVAPVLDRGRVDEAIPIVSAMSEAEARLQPSPG